MEKLSRTRQETTHKESRQPFQVNSPRANDKKLSEQDRNSIAESMLSDIEHVLGLKGLFDGKIVHLSFDCPKNLREAFNVESKANGTSACKNLQHFMAAYIASSRIKKHALGNTISRALDVPFTIGALNFTQNNQSRPRRLVREGVSEVDREVEEPGREVEGGVRAVDFYGADGLWKKISTERVNEQGHAVGCCCKLCS